MKSIIQLFVKRPVTTLMVILVFVAFGIMSLTNLQMDLMPNMNIPVAIVSTTYTGAGSEEVETLITGPIESAMATISGIDTITSTSSNGSSLVIIQFNEDVDLDFATLDMRENIDLVSSILPDDASDPMILKLDINSMTSITLGVESDSASLTELQNVVEENIIDELEKQAGVASVSMTGGSENEVVVEFIPDKLNGYGLSTSTIQALLYSENQNTPTGSVTEGNSILSLRVQGEFQSIEDISMIPLTTPTGSIIHVGDVANVYEAEAERTSYSYIDGEPAITLAVSKESDANTVEVSDAIVSEIETLNSGLDGVTITMLQDPADYIRNSISSVASSAIVGGLFAVIILFIFLRDIRSTLIVGLAMPISMIFTFFLMDLSGLTINIMSLGGLTLGVGMLVDNSIVVIESIYRKIESGEDKFHAAVDGASEVAMSVIASTLTTIVVFLPITFQGGLTAQIFNSLSFTISFSLASSLFVALTFLPMASAIFLVPEDEKIKKGIVYKALTKFNQGFSKLESGYKSVLFKAINHRKIVAVLILVFFVATGLSLTRIGTTFMPETDEGYLLVTATMPEGTELEVTRETGQEVSDILMADPNVDQVTMSVGSSGAMSALTGASTDISNLIVYLVPKDERTLDEIGDIQRQLRNDLASIPGTEINVSSPSSVSTSSSDTVDITIKGDELDTLYDISDNMIALGETLEGVEETTTSVEDTVSQANIIMKRDKAMTYGITSSTVASTINTEVNGLTATTYKKGDGTELDVVLRSENDNVDYINDIENILIPTATGSYIPVYEVADIEISQEAPSIEREGQQRYITISFESDGSPTSVITDALNAKMEEQGTLLIPSGYTWEYSGTTEDMNETFASLTLALLMAVILVYMVMAAQFESFMYPFIVMFAIPMAVTGGVFGLGLVGEEVSITTFLGLIMLAGMVINNAIVLIDYINLQIRENGKTLDEAILLAGPVRLRPIIMSVLTTCLGLLPMAVSNAEGAELMSGLAMVVIFGLLFSTVVTLILIPVIYKTMYLKKEQFTNRMNIRRAKKVEKIKAHNEKINNK